MGLPETLFFESLTVSILIHRAFTAFKPILTSHIYLLTSPIPRKFSRSFTPKSKVGFLKHLNRETVVDQFHPSNHPTAMSSSHSEQFSDRSEDVASGDGSIKEMMLRGTVEIMHRHLQTDSQGNPLQENEETR